MKRQMIITIAMAVLLAGTAFASEWNFYGSARVETFWTDSDQEDTTNLSESLQGNARIGAKVIVSDELTGRFEYGASDEKANIRLLYGEWKFGTGSLLVGQDWTPLYLPVSNQVYADDAGLEGWGEASPGRHAQVKLKFGGFHIAIISPDTTYFKNDGNGTIDSDDLDDSNTEVVIPRIEACYKMDINQFSLAVGGGYNTFEYNDDEDIDAYAGIIRAQFQAAGFTMGVQGFAGQNVGNIITTDTTGDQMGNGYAKIDGSDRVVDNDALGAEVVVGYKVNDMFALEAGYGYTETEYDDGSDSDEVAAYYLQAPITMAPGVTIVPEVGMIDYHEDNQDEITYIGAKWQINF